MARVSRTEFDQLIEELAAACGLGKLQEKVLSSHALVSRRRLGSAQAVAAQLYPLTGGLERDGPATRVVLALWEELLASKLDDELTKGLEAVADRINGCLTPRNEVDPDREEDLRSALLEYRSTLGGRVGERAAQLTMLMRAVPEVAKRIRER